MGAGSFGGMNIAVTAAIMNNTRNYRRGYGGGGGGPETPEPLGEKEEVEVVSDRKGRFLLVPYLTDSGYCFWKLYIEVTVTKGFFKWKKQVKEWKYINNFAGRGTALEAARHYLKNSEVVDLCLKD